MLSAAAPLIKRGKNDDDILGNEFFRNVLKLQVLQNNCMMDTQSNMNTIYCWVKHIKLDCTLA